MTNQKGKSHLDYLQEKPYLLVAVIVFFLITLYSFAIFAITPYMSTRAQSNLESFVSTLDYPDSFQLQSIVYSDDRCVVGTCPKITAGYEADESLNTFDRCKTIRSTLIEVGFSKDDRQANDDTCNINGYTLEQSRILGLLKHKIRVWNTNSICSNANDFENDDFCSSENVNYILEFSLY